MTAFLHGNIKASATALLIAHYKILLSIIALIAVYALEPKFLFISLFAILDLLTNYVKLLTPIKQIPIDFITLGMIYCGLVYGVREALFVALFMVLNRIPVGRLKYRNITKLPVLFFFAFAIPLFRNRTIIEATILLYLLRYALDYTLDYFLMGKVNTKRIPIRIATVIITYLFSLFFGEYLISLM